MRIVCGMVCLLCLTMSSASAQGLRISTILYDAGRLSETGQESVLSNSVSFQHNGRTYDYVESAGEVVIFEPSAKRFTVLNIHRGVSTTIAFDQIVHLLNARQPRTEEYLKELTGKNSPEAERASRMLAFQLNPNFTTTFNRRSGILSLKSPSWKYVVTTREWADEEQREKYLTYTDWMARLNYILHPQSMFPEPRLAMNLELRKLTNRMPVSVQLDLRPDERIILRAEHQFVQNLGDSDRNLIMKWDEAVRNNTLRSLPLRKYQESILISQGR